MPSPIRTRALWLTIALLLLAGGLTMAQPPTEEAPPAQLAEGSSCDDPNLAIESSEAPVEVEPLIPQRCPKWCTPDAPCTTDCECGIIDGGVCRQRLDGSKRCICFA